MRIKWVFFFIWIFCVVAFFIGQFLAPPNYSNVPHNPWGIFFGASVVFGISSFMLMLFFIYLGTGEKNNKKKLSKKSKDGDDFGKQKYYLIGGLVILLLSVGVLSAKEVRLKQDQKDKLYNLSQNAIPSPIPIPTPKPTPKAYVDPDPVIDCVSSYPNCNGESIRLKRSQCSNITCCGFGDGRWEVYPSTEKCKQAQQGSQPTQQAQKTTTLNFYCYNNTNKYSYYTSSGEQCNKDNFVSSCKGIVKSTYDMCMNSCLSTANSDGSICIKAYFGNNAVIENNPNLYEECKGEVTDNHQTCMNACSIPYQEESSKCNSYY